MCDFSRTTTGNDKRFRGRPYGQAVLLEQARIQPGLCSLKRSYCQTLTIYLPHPLGWSCLSHVHTSFLFIFFRYLCWGLLMRGRAALKTLFSWLSPQCFCTPIPSPSPSSRFHGPIKLLEPLIQGSLNSEMSPRSVLNHLTLDQTKLQCFMGEMDKVSPLPWALASCFYHKW